MTRLQASWFFIKRDIRCLIGIELLGWAMNILPEPYSTFVAVAVININTASHAEKEKRIGPAR